MQASELLQIVKDVPREAWPAVAFQTMDYGKYWIGTNGLYPGTDSIVEAAFVGGMTAWLAANDWMPKCDIHRDGARVVLSDDSTHRASSLVAALAAACKEVSNG